MRKLTGLVMFVAVAMVLGVTPVTMAIDELWMGGENTSSTFGTNGWIQRNDVPTAALIGTQPVGRGINAAGLDYHGGGGSIGRGTILAAAQVDAGVIEEFDTSGNFIQNLITGLYYPMQVHTSTANGDILVHNATSGDHLELYDRNGASLNASFTSIVSVNFADDPNTGNWYIVDALNKKVQKVSPTGSVLDANHITGLAGAGGEGIAVGFGSIYVAENDDTTSAVINEYALSNGAFIREVVKASDLAGGASERFRDLELSPEGRQLYFVGFDWPNIGEANHTINLVTGALTSPFAAFTSPGTSPQPRSLAYVPEPATLGLLSLGGLLILRRRRA